MAKFVKFMSRAHLNRLNVSLYTSAGGAILRAEQVPSDKALGAKRFDSEDAAIEWYESLPGSGLGRLANAIEKIRVA